MRGKTICILTAVTILLISSAGPGCLFADDIHQSDADLQLDVRFTYGPGGGERPASFIAGDTVAVTLRATGLSIGSDGKMDLFLQPELLDSDGHTLMMLNPLRCNDRLTFGGNELTFFWAHPIPVLMAAGKYGFRITIRDRISGQKVTRDMAFEVLPESTFGALRLRLAHDVQGTVAAGACFLAGSRAFLFGQVMGYDHSSGRMHVKAKLTFYDLQGQELSPSATIPVERDVPKAPEGVGPHTTQVYFTLPLNRAGRFVVRLELEDVLGDKTATYDVPITVTAPPVAVPPQNLEASPAPAPSG